MKVAMKKIVTWIGDQLTVDQLCGLFKFQAEDENLFERMDYSVIIWMASLTNGICKLTPQAIQWHFFWQGSPTGL